MREFQIRTKKHTFVVKAKSKAQAKRLARKNQKVAVHDKIVVADVTPLQADELKEKLITGVR